MNFDWLFGPPTSRLDFSGTCTLRSMTVEPDTIREVYQMIDSQLGGAVLHRTALDPDPLDPVVIKSIDDLETMPDWERRNLRIQDVNGHFTVILNDGRPPTILNNGLAAEPQYAEAAREIAAKLLVEGRPRLPLGRLTLQLPWLIWLLAAASWVWLLVREDPHLTFAVFGTALLLLSSTGAQAAKIQMSNRYGLRGVGLRIRSISRAEVRQRRADRWADLKLSAITIPAGALVGALVTWLAGGGG